MTTSSIRESRLPVAEAGVAAQVQAALKHLREATTENDTPYDSALSCREAARILQKLDGFGQETQLATKAMQKLAIADKEWDEGDAMAQRVAKLLTNRLRSMKK